MVDRVTLELFGQILDGAFGPGARLPPERDIAARTGASRVSVRSAIGRLADWGVVRSRHGSGITVMPRRSWTTAALAGLIAHAIERRDFDSLVPVVRDAFALRRWMILDLLVAAAERFASLPATQRAPLGAARDLVERAYAARKDASAFIVLDREVLPAILEQAQMLPSLFLVNSLAAPYLSVMRVLAIESPAPPSYRQRHLAMIEAVERGDSELARVEMSAYLDELDARLVAKLPLEVRKALARMAL